jgi:hypothetical protein
MSKTRKSSNTKKSRSQKIIDYFRELFRYFRKNRQKPDLGDNSVLNVLHQNADANEVSQPVKHQDGFTCKYDDNESRFKPYLEDLFDNINKNKQALINLQNVKNHMFWHSMEEAKKNEINQLEVESRKVIKDERKLIGKAMVELYKMCLKTNPTNGKIFNYLDKFKTELEYFDQDYVQYSDDLNSVKSLPLFIPPRPNYAPSPPRNQGSLNSQSFPNYLPPLIPKGGKRKTKGISKRRKNRSYKLF